MTRLQGVILRTEGRGFIIAAGDHEQHQPARGARRQAWFQTLPTDDRQTVTAWLGIWARQRRGRRRSI